MPIYFSLEKYKLSFKFIQSFFRKYFATKYLVPNTLCPSKGYLVDDRNVHIYIFSVLNLTIICIKLFTCNNTILSFSFLNETLFLQTHHHCLHLNLHRTLTDWLTDSASIHEWYSFPNACIFHNSMVWWVMLLCDLYL